MHAEGGDKEQPSNQDEMPEPKGNLKFLNLQAWSFYYSTYSGKQSTDVFESIKLNTQLAKGDKQPFDMGGKTFNLQDMTVTIQGETFLLKKSKRNVRKRPDGHSKGGTAGLLGSNSKDYKELGIKFAEQRAAATGKEWYETTTSISEILWGLMDHYL